MPGAEPAGKRLAVHARKLALEPDLQVLRRHRRPLLRRLEQARRSTLEDHVHRPARLGLQVVIKESWYNPWALKASANPPTSSATPSRSCTLRLARKSRRCRLTTARTRRQRYSARR